MVRRKLLRKDRHYAIGDLLLDGRRGLQADQEFVLLTELLQLGIAQAVCLQNFPRFVDPDRLIELQLHRGSAREIDTEVGSSPGNLNDRQNSQYRHDAGKDKGQMALPHKIEICFSE